jgi:hypothetical protein
MKMKFYLSGILLIAAYYIPFMIMGEDSYIRTQDTLNTNMYGYGLLKLLNYYHHEVFPQIMNGLPREMYVGSGYSICGLLFHVLPTPFIAYVVNDFLCRMIGFLGMFLLLDKHIIRDDVRLRLLIICATSIIYSFLGSYNIQGGLTIMGQPLLFYTFANLYKGQNKWWNYLIILFISFYSSFAYMGIFACIILGGIWLYEVVKKRQFHWSFVLGILLLFTGYVIVEHQLIYYTFIDKSAMVSHRELLAHPVPGFTENLIRHIREYGLLSNYYPGMFFTPVVVLAVCIGFITNTKKDNGLLYIKLDIDKMSKYIVLSIVGIFLFVFLYSYMRAHLEKYIKLIAMFDWRRFFFMLSTLWMILFALSLQNIGRRLSAKKGNIVIAGFIACMFLNVCAYNIELTHNARLLLTGKSGSPTYSQFFDFELFDKIKKDINEPQESYRIVSVGLEANIALQNGFYCLDGYLSLYPLAYKEQFREMISDELAKDKAIKQCFDNFGCQCYVFSAELGVPKPIIQNFQDNKIHNLSFNTQKFKEMGGKYVLSAVEIENADDIDLSLRNVFSGKYWTIWLYGAR